MIRKYLKKDNPQVFLLPYGSACLALAFGVLFLAPDPAPITPAQNDLRATERHTQSTNNANATPSCPDEPVASQISWWAAHSGAEKGAIIVGTILVGCFLVYFGNKDNKISGFESLNRGYKRETENNKKERFKSVPNPVPNIPSMDENKESERKQKLIIEVKFNEHREEENSTPILPPAKRFPICLDLKQSLQPSKSPCLSNSKSSTTVLLTIPPPSACREEENSTPILLPAKRIPICLDLQQSSQHSKSPCLSNSASSTKVFLTIPPPSAFREEYQTSLEACKKTLRERNPFGDDLVSLITEYAFDLMGMDHPMVECSDDDDPFPTCKESDQWYDNTQLWRRERRKDSISLSVLGHWEREIRLPLYSDLKNLIMEWVQSPITVLAITIRNNVGSDDFNNIDFQEKVNHMLDNCLQDNLRLNKLILSNFMQNDEQCVPFPLNVPTSIRSIALCHGGMLFTCAHTFDHLEITGKQASIDHLVRAYKPPEKLSIYPKDNFITLHSLHMDFLSKCKTVEGRSPSKGLNIRVGDLDDLKVLSTSPTLKAIAIDRLAYTTGEDPKFACRKLKEWFSSEEHRMPTVENIIKD